MKRALGLIFLVVTCIAGFLTVKGALPFMPVFDHGMEPALPFGSLLMVKNVAPGDVKAGDIIVYDVPAGAQDYYHYPPTVSRRVTEIKTAPSLVFSTRGDSASADPFTVGPADVRGAVGAQLPFLGLPLLLFRSQPGLVFIAVALVLLTISLYRRELFRGGNLWRRRLFSPLNNEPERTGRAQPRQLTRPEEIIAPAGRDRVPLSPAGELEKEPVETEKIATRPGPAAPGKIPSWHQKSLEKMKTSLRPQSATETPGSSLAAMDRSAPPGCARKQPKPAREIHAAAKETPAVFDGSFDRRGLTGEALAAEQEIFSALDRLQNRLFQFKALE
jgi:signal peptidase I